MRGKHAKPVNGAEMPCKLRRLIVAPPVIAAAMKRDRHDQRIVLYQLDKEPRHETCQEGRQLQAVTMLESKNQVARAAGVTEAAADGGKSWRRRPAGGAERIGKRVAQGQPAALADWRGDRCKIFPAGGTETCCFGKTAAQHALVRHNQVSKPAAGFRKWPAKCSRQVHDADSLAAGGKDSVKGAASFCLRYQSGSPKVRSS